METVWLFIVGALLSIIGFLIVIILNAIRHGITEVKETLHSLETDMRAGVAGLDRRVLLLETLFHHHIKRLDTLEADMQAMERK